MARSKLAAVAGAAAAACILHVTACEDSTYLLEGRFYRDDRDCLGTTSSVDVVSGEPPGQCPPACLVQRAYDGGTAVYVTTMCGPYPLDLDASGTDPRCAPAIAAFERDATCLVGGGSSAPLPDAGDDGG